MTPEEEKNALLNAVLPVSVDLLEEHGGFHPHGAAIDGDGEITTAMADIGEELPEGDEVIAALVQAFREEVAHGGVRATAIASNVAIEQDESTMDAILVVIEHPEDDPTAIAVFMPYEREHDEAPWQFGDLQAQATEPAVFAGG